MLVNIEIIDLWRIGLVLEMNQATDWLKSNGFKPTDTDKTVWEYAGPLTEPYLKLSDPSLGTRFHQLKQPVRVKLVEAKNLLLGCCICDKSSKDAHDLEWEKFGSR